GPTDQESPLVPHRARSLLECPLIERRGSRNGLPSLAGWVEEREIDHGGGHRSAPGLDRPFDAEPGARVGALLPNRAQADGLLDDRAPRRAGGPPDLAPSVEHRDRPARA